VTPSTLPREYYTSGEIYREEMERVFLRAVDLPGQGRGQRRARGIPGAGGGEPPDRPRTRWRRARLLQRLPASRLPALHTSTGASPGSDDVPLLRLVLRAGRTAPVRASHGGRSRIRSGEVSPSLRAAGDVAELHLACDGPGGGVRTRSGVGAGRRENLHRPRRADPSHSRPPGSAATGRSGLWTLLGSTRGESPEERLASRIEYFRPRQAALGARLLVSLRDGSTRGGAKPRAERRAPSSHPIAPAVSSRSWWSPSTRKS
jgi:hypothetical protein